MQTRLVTLALMLAMFAFAARRNRVKYYGSAPTDPLTVTLLEKEQALMARFCTRRIDVQRRSDERFCVR